MAWYHVPGNEQDVVISTRVRFARNLAAYPFPSRLDATGAKEIIEKVGALLESNGFQKTDFSDISRTMAYSLVEKHYASPAFIRESLPHALYLNEPCNLSVMLCEEDHIRLQCILPGLSLQDAYKGACKVEQLLDDTFDLAFDDTLGYLTHCPTNLGTAMRASVMMFLPATTLAGRMEALATRLGQLGLTVRGLYGEGSGADGYLYQISNQVTLGVSEEATLRKLEDVIQQIMDNERKWRRSIGGAELVALTDRVMRAEGTLKYAYTLSSQEFLRLSADVRLGVAMGIIKDIRMETLTSLLIEAMPATLTLSADTIPKNDNERDRTRAEYVRQRLQQDAAHPTIPQAKEEHT